MKAIFVAWVAVPLVGFSSLSSAHDAVPTQCTVTEYEPMLLTGADLDEVTAAGHLVTVKTGEIQVIGDVTIRDNVNGNKVNVTVDEVSVPRQSFKM
jgi:hypothetical protein